MMNPEEDSDHYQIGFTWAKEMLRTVLSTHTAPVPSLSAAVHTEAEALSTDASVASASAVVHVETEAEMPEAAFHQVNGDWTPALRKDYETFVDLVVTDLEHLYRNLDRRRDLTIETRILKKYCRSLAYVPNFFLGSLFWTVKLQRMNAAWKCPSFAKYFRTHCLRGLIHNGEKLWA